MTNVQFPLEEYEDIEVRNAYQDLVVKNKTISEDDFRKAVWNKSRDNARVPMQWDDSVNAGFSNAKKEMLYIAQDSDENRPTVKNQAADENSLYNEIKKLIKIRKEHTALLSKGEIEFVAAKKDTYPLAYVRSSEDEKILVVINPSAKEVTFEFDAKPGETIYSFGGSVESDGKTVKASGQTAAFIKLA